MSPMKPLRLHVVNETTTRSLKLSWDLFLVAFLCFLPSLCLATGASPQLFPYGTHQGDLPLARDNDDVSSPEFRLQIPIKFYGTQYHSVYINQNGLVSFLTDIPTFVNIQFPLDYPTIAPLYSDVDTRIVGTVLYRETMDDDLLERARTLLSDHFSSATNFQPTGLLIVTWDSVGYYDRKSDKMNTFQLVVASDGGDSYAIFLYDKIEWIQGTGKNPNLPDAKAQAGIVSGNGPHFTLKGSGTDQVSNLHKRSNMNEDGAWAFRVGRVVGDTIEEPDLNVDLESSSEATSTCAAGGTTQCHSQAECLDFEPGFCCRCARGFYGNGRICLQDDIPLRMNGKVRGVLNGIGIEDADLFSYILPQDGRSYTAIAKIPERLGFDLQTVIVLGTSIGWLYSTRVKNAPNGFQLTGGVLNYTADISFYQTGQKVQINQNFMGLDVFSHMKVDTRIHGNTPVVPVGKSIEVNDVKMQFTRVSPGIIRSRSSHAYTIEGTSIENPFSIEQTVEYIECPWSSPVPPELETTTMKVGRNYIVYDISQQIARYAITSKVTPVDGEDPCKENKSKCGPNSSCVVDGENFKCICNLGYEEHYNYEEEEERPASETPQCVDIDECQIGTSTCDVTASCINSEGSHSCQCQQGYAGDGYTCTKILTCADVQCGPNAECLEISVGEPECRCLQGFTGDGLFCYHHTGIDVETGTAPDCRQVGDLCDHFAECIFSHSSQSHVCSCLPGYSGDGMVCHREPTTETCDVEDTCHSDANCVLDEQNNEYICQCREGFDGDGYTCMPTRDHSTVRSSYPIEEAPEPSCVLNFCFCSAGYVYDDKRRRCQLAVVEVSTNPEVTCQQDGKICDQNAACTLQGDSYSCVCREGFNGDGKRCTPQDFCSSHSECSPYGQCAYDDQELRYSCQCRTGFTGDGKDCRPKGDVGCDVLRNCDVNARCSWDASKSKYACECNAGFRGDGLTCQEDLLGCNILKNCAANADCDYDSQARGYRCQCKQGYEGDGYRCRSSVPCYQDRSVCDANADCLPNIESREYQCQCKSGFIGDGHVCREATRPGAEGQFLIVTKGMSLIKVPLSGEKSLPLTVEPFQTAIGIDIDCPNGRVYWSDVATRAIKVAYFNGTDKSTFLDDEIGSPEGLSVDWASQNLYWTDSLKDTIEVANLKTKKRKIIVSTGLVNPRGIAAYPQRGRLFWSDWNREYPKIEYSGLDGQERQILVGEGLALPNSLVVDSFGDQLCWADAGTHKIECVGIDGRNRRPYVTKVKYPFGLALGVDTFYWSDWETKRIESASRSNGETGQSIEVSLGGPGKLYGIVSVPSTCPQTYSSCEYNSCGEESICLPNARGGRSCVCSDTAGSTCQNTF